MAARAIKFGSHLKELRLHLCQTGETSKGVRDFIQNHYVSLKSANPLFPILVREASGVEPRLYARYEFGKETHTSLANLPAEQVMAKIEQAANSK
ncbi:unnamed protein product [Bemisia tabaci]|uniref:NADH dehydrogenase [ubiquinone] 1 alpha subcomplex subunit 2 n=1 Tax=Bemisia tabaci TaxID=7038 RepID=A0A9P0A490_BEMTA|nr:PREDICTED: NADH dehydrogenase [ubiquinone] 1 alpha subcomplex subunit 2 [Bemisia tabaci]CAH0386053.1 unnamed protein product [Bemisia tabaci]